MALKLEEHRNANQLNQVGMLQNSQVAHYSVIQGWSLMTKLLAVNFANQITLVLRKENRARNVLNTLLQTRIILFVFHMI